MERSESLEPLHDNIIEFKLTGESAIFTDPLTATSGELSSYQVPTFSALQGIAESNYWKPTIMWEPLAVRILNPIRLEPRSKLFPKFYKQESDLAYHVYLRDVEYQVRVAMKWSNDPNYINDRNPKKHMESAKRWLSRGGKKPISLGKNECYGYIEPCVFGEGKGYYDNIDMSLGLMFHGTTYPNAAYNKQTEEHLTTRLFFCNMENGIITFPSPKDCPIQRQLRKEAPVWIPPKSLG
jgi:CRISPR-associated protein Cas5d